MGSAKPWRNWGSSHTVLYHERAIRLLPQHSINATVRGIWARRSAALALFWTFVAVQSTFCWH